MKSRICLQFDLQETWLCQDTHVRNSCVSIIYGECLVKTDHLHKFNLELSRQLEITKYMCIYLECSMTPLMLNIENIRTYCIIIY